MRRFPLPVVRLGDPKEELSEDGEPGVPLRVRGECGLAGSCCAVRFPWNCSMGGGDVGVVEWCGCHNTTALGWIAEPLACSVEVVPEVENICRRLVEREA